MSESSDAQAILGALGISDRQENGPHLPEVGDNSPCRRDQQLSDPTSYEV